MKVSELIDWLQTLEPDWEIAYDDGSENGEEISHIRVYEDNRQYRLE